MKKLNVILKLNVELDSIQDQTLSQTILGIVKSGGTLNLKSQSKHVQSVSKYISTHIKDGQCHVHDVSYTLSIPKES